MSSYFKSKKNIDTNNTNINQRYRKHRESKINILKILITLILKHINN